LHRFFLAAVLAAMTALHCATGGAVTAPKDELREIRSRIEALKKQLDESVNSKADAADALKHSERAVSETSRKLYRLTSQRKEVNAELSKLQARMHVMEGEIAGEQATLSRLLYQQYIGGESDAVKLVANGQDPNEIARQLHYLGYVSRARAELLASLRDNLTEVEKLAGETREKSAELTSLQTEEIQQMRKLEKEKAERQRVYAQVSDDLEKNRKRLSTLKLDEERLTQLMERLAKEAAKKEAARKEAARKEAARKEAARREAARKKGVKPEKRAEVVATPEAESGFGPFRQLKGRLRLPVAGELMNRFGSPRRDSGLSWKGLFISTKSGREVKAVAGGRVVYADWLRGFGNLLILDHGGGYMSLYGNNESLLKQVGEEANAGDAVAATGNSGGNPDSGLYFELRYQGKPFDPIPWVTLK
jgi:septal ring factor EnvC (AmiA/AmiB activator)